MKALRIILPLAMLASIACNPCKRASRHLSRAVWLCPEATHQDSATATGTATVPGDTAAGSAAWSDTLTIDSLACLVLQYREALASADTLRLHDLEHMQSVLAHLRKRIRTSACTIAPLIVQDSVKTLRIWTEGGRLRYELAVNPRVVKVPVKVPVRVVEQAKANDAAAEESAPPWYAWAIIVVFGALISLQMFGGKRNV